MSEINRDMPEGLPPKAMVINFEAAKGRRLEEKIKPAKWIQERIQSSIAIRSEGTSLDASQSATEAIQTTQPAKQGEFSAELANEGRKNRYPSDPQNNIIDFDKWKEKRLLIQQEVSTDNPVMEAGTSPPSVGLHQEGSFSILRVAKLI
jgi:hypothetical protein